MQKNEFLNDRDTHSLCVWLGDIISCKRGLNFTHATGTYPTLDQALGSYAWPPKRVDFMTPAGPRSLAKESSLADNEAILDELSCGLRASLNKKYDNELIQWVEAVLKWGGVFTRLGNGGNAGWLDAYRMKGGLSDYLSNAISNIELVESDQIGNQIENIRSNAGLTKIYSLMCEKFVIYDSRVAAALTWLITKWSANSGEIPAHLRFLAMRANTSKKSGKLRSANTNLFPYFSPSGTAKNHVKHLLWNIRANWLLSKSLEIAIQSGESGKIRTLRDLEASLFVIGDDLSNSRLVM